MKKTYVEFIIPGMVFADYQNGGEVEDRNPHKIGDIPEFAVAFRFYDQTIAIVDGEELVGERQNVSGAYYINARVYTVEDVKREMPSERILISNIENNNWNRCVKTRHGNIMPFREKDKNMPYPFKPVDRLADRINNE